VRDYQKKAIHVYDINVGAMSGHFESQFTAESPATGAETVTKDMQIRLQLSNGPRESSCWKARVGKKRSRVASYGELGPNAIISSIDEART